MVDAVDFAEITDGCPSGEGVFDQLMKSVKSHLKEEYDEQRIRGSEYTQVYLGGLQGAMSQAIQWQLGAQIAENQAALIAVQIEAQEKQVLLLEEQRQQLIAQTALIVEQTEGQTLNNLNIAKQGVILDVQEEQIVKGIELTTAQILQTEEATLTATYGRENTLPAQVAILTQKLITEEAQTKDVTAQGTVTGVLGKQKELYGKQTDGFDRDAEQKAARIVADVWGIAVSADVTGDSIPTEVNVTNMDEMLVDLKTSAGLD